MKIARDKVVSRLLFAAGIVILILYSLRHVSTGIDLMDAGYNYTNFQYPGLEYMDSMWYFSTWLANQVGTFLTKLPFGNTMLGMNVYTGLIVGAMAVVSWVFAVKKLKVPAWLALIGELIALSLCWAPGAVLYSYLTYLLLLAGTLLLYKGLTADKTGYLVAAGVVLGCNVGIRFSNLPQMALIIAVWSYGLIRRKKFSQVLKETGFCILGYVGAFGAYLLLISAVYGLPAYVEGIMRLFGMTETATDYAPSHMLLELIDTYYQRGYWIKRMVIAAAAGMAVCAVLPAKWVKVKRALIVVITLLLAAWLLKAGFVHGNYHVYSSIFEITVSALVLLLLGAGCVVIGRQSSANDKLMAILVAITVLITSLGSNNAVFSSINNLFLVMPWFLGVVWTFFREKKSVWYFPIQCVVMLTLVMLLWQSLQFGRIYVYEEATGGRHLDTVIEEVPVLKGIRTSSGKAAALEGLYGYLDENGLTGRECLLYGQIPGIAYYMELPPAMNIWSDLMSYTYETMEKDIGRIREEIAEGGQQPLIILEAKLLGYLDNNASGDEVFYDATAEEKMQLIRIFMEDYGYVNVFLNERFAVFQ